MLNPIFAGVILAKVAGLLKKSQASGQEMGINCSV